TGIIAGGQIVRESFSDFRLCLPVMVGGGAGRRRRTKWSPHTIRQIGQSFASIAGMAIIAQKQDQDRANPINGVKSCRSAARSAARYRDRGSPCARKSAAPQVK